MKKIKKYPLGYNDPESQKDNAIWNAKAEVYALLFLAMSIVPAGTYWLTKTYIEKKVQEDVAKILDTEEEILQIKENILDAKQNMQIQWTEEKKYDERTMDITNDVLQCIEIYEATIDCRKEKK